MLEELIALAFVPTEEMIADIFTKSLCQEKFDKFKSYDGHEEDRDEEGVLSCNCHGILLAMNIEDERRRLKGTEMSMNMQNADIAYVNA